MILLNVHYRVLTLSQSSEWC